VPTLLEIQDAVYRSLVEGDDAPASRHISDDGLAPNARLKIHRNTFVGSLTTALRLSYPAVQRLVGAVFFEVAARLFIEAGPPRSAWLDSYGADFPDFLASFPPAGSFPYLPGVARLEWAVNVALHAPDVPALDLGCFSTFDRADHERVALVMHPAVGLVRSDFPVDAIWRAVLAQDEAAMAAIDVDSGPVWLMIDRQFSAVDVRRVDERAWHAMADLYAGRPVLAAIRSLAERDGAAFLAEHLAAGRFTQFKLIDDESIQPVQETGA
jgi:Putative DNA-binding domain